MGLFVAGAGFEPATSGLWAPRATGLLYPAICFLFVLERVNGIEPSYTAWKAVVLAIVLHPHGGAII